MALPDVALPDMTCQPESAAAKEAGILEDMDSSATKLIDVVEIGKQLLITRGGRTTFSLANEDREFDNVMSIRLQQDKPGNESAAVGWCGRVNRRPASAGRPAIPSRDGGAAG